MKSKNIRASSNLKMLEFVARRLGPLNEQVVYVGGCATALIINDPLASDVRQTMDVDCIVDVISFSKYHQFENELRKLGFAQSIEDDIRCRWRIEEMILDVMPTDETILGFGNLWYKDALDAAIAYQIADDLTVKSIKGPYFLATKIEAFKSRGNNDFYASHDLEDIIAVLAGCVELMDEISLVHPELNLYLKIFFNELLSNDQFEQILPGHLNDGPITMQRVQQVLNRIKQIVG